jgi:uncharacterized membrane protein YccC
MGEKGFPPTPGLVTAGAMLLVALLPLPYGYYILLRWVVAAAAGYAAWWAYSHRRFVWPWPLGALAILFNPLVPLYMRRSDWQFFDLMGSAVAFAAAVLLRRRSLPGRDADSSQQ